MLFRVFGPVELTAADRVVDPGPPQRRTVLAALLVDAGRPVSVASLVNRVWGDEPPAGAHRALYAHVARLRSTFAEVAPGCLVRGPGGYVLNVDPDDVDLHRFRRLADRAAAAALSDGEGAALLRAALDLWRGEPLAGIPGDWADRVRDRWWQRRVDVTVRWAEAELRLGRATRVLDDLLLLVSEHPLSEPPVAVLMRALHATGRSGEALTRYAELRERLADELGTEPAAEVRRLHQAILREEVPDPGSAPAPSSRPVPAQLPPDVPAFTGRLAELAALSQATGPDGRSATAVVISALSGTAGVGKTALAVHWAHRVRDRFPDGQLYVDLRGYGPEPPTEPAEALAGILRELGVDGADMPVDLTARTTRYRSLVAGRRMLVLLDNVAAADQARPLLPGSPACTVVVTSRDSLAGLVARDGAHRVSLDLLPLADAVALLGSLIGDRVTDDPASAVLLAERCARLPLALRVAAELAIAHPYRDLRSLADDLRAERDRLDVLDAGGDDDTAVRAVLSWSYRHLPAPAARVFRLLGAHPGREFDTYAVAALAEVTEGTARRLVDVLHRAHLVHHVTAGRYGMHDLLRAYAVECGADDDGRDGAVARLHAFYLGNAAAAVDHLYPAERHGRHRIMPPPMAAPGASDPVTAHAWLDRERPNLVAVVAAASTHRPADTTALAATLRRYLDIGGHHTEAYTVHTHALEAAHRIDDPAEIGAALLHLGTVHWRRGDTDRAVDHYERAMSSLRDGGDRHGCARVLGNLGIVRWQQGRFDEATEHYRRAGELHREVGDQVSEARMLSNLGLLRVHLGHHDEAAELQHRALAVYRRTGDRYGEIGALNALANIAELRDDLGSAVEHYGRALAIARETGNAGDAATVLANLGGVYRQQGRYDAALEHLCRALPMIRDAGVPTAEAWTLDEIGLVHQRIGDNDQAIEHHRAAVAVATRYMDRNIEAAALNSLGEACAAAGHHAEAGSSHRRALAVADEIGNPAQQARARAGLARLPARTDS